MPPQTQINSTIFKTTESKDENGIVNTKIVTTLQARNIAQEQLNATLAKEAARLDTDINCLLTYENALKEGEVNTATFAEIMNGASVKAQEYAIRIKEGTGATELYAEEQKKAQAELKTTANTSNFTSKAFKALSVATNMIAFTLIVKGLQLAATALDHYINRAKYAAEAMEEAQKKINDAQNTLKTISTTINGNRDRFLELSEGVSQFSKNLSLSESDYAEYLSLSQKIAEIAPSLIVGYDEQGNALLNIGGNAKETNEMLNELLETQQALAKQTLIDNFDDVALGVYYEVEESKQNLYKLRQELANQELSALNFDFADIFENNDGIFKFTEADDPFGEYRNALTESLDAANIGWEDLGNGQISINDFSNAMDNGGKDLHEVMDIALKDAQDYYDKKLDKNKNVYNANIDDLERNIQREENIIKNSYSKMTANLQAWVAQDANYQYLSDNAQSIVDALIPQINWENTNPANGETYQDYINNNILLPLMDIKPENKAEVEKMFSELLSFQDGDLDIVPFAKQLQSKLKALGIDIDITPIFVDEQSAMDKLQNSIGKIAEGSDYYNSFGKQVDAQEYRKLQKYTEGFTSEQVEIWTEATLGAENATDAINRYEEALAANKPPVSFTDTLSQIESLSKGFNQLNKIYADVYDKEDFDWSSILNNEEFAETFGDLDDSTKEYKNAYNDFIETISNSPDDINACQEAFNNLASTFLYSAEDASGTRIMENLTQETRGATIALLEQMGVENAKEIIDAQLAAQEMYHALSIDESTASIYQKITGLLNESEASGVAYAALFQLVAEEQIFSNGDLNTEQKIQELEKLAKAYGISADAAIASSAAMSKMEKLEAEGASDEEIEAAWNDILNTNYSAYSDAISDKFGSISVHYTGVKNTTSGMDKDSGTNSSASERDTTKTFDWIETALDRIQSAYDRLSKTASSVYKTFTKRNSALAQEISNIRQQITLNQKAYEAYMNKADSVGLSGYYKNLVQNGTISIQDITDETLQEQIQTYQDWYEKAIACSDAISELKQNIAELAQEKFDNISKEFDSQLSVLEHKMNLIEGNIDQTEERGYLISQQYYQALIDTENQNISILNKEYQSLKSSLQDALNTGEIESYSEAWYDMVSDIYDVEEALQEANTALIEYQNTMRQLKWDYFDLGQDYISNITDEADFLIDLLSRNKLFDEKGFANSFGTSVEGLHAVNYNTYMSQADDYAKELAQINKELAKDPYNTTLIDRRSELLELQRDAIKSAQDEMEAIRDLVSEGYDLQLDYLDRLINKRKDALQAEKDLYDYQKNISEQTKAIAEYEKQLSAYEGDTSEETRATIQRLKVSLEEARQDLQDSEYDKWISDQERLMDDLYSEYESMLNQRLDDLDGLVQDIIDQTNLEASEIRNTITSEAQSMGYTLTETMKTIWSVDNGIGKVVSDYSSNFTSIMTGVQSGINSIRVLLEQMIQKSDSEAAAKNQAVNSSAGSVPSSTTPSAPQAKPTTTTNSSTTWGSWFVTKKDYFPKNQLNIEYSIVDRLKYHDIDSSPERRKEYYKKMGGTGTYTGTSEQNQWMIRQMKAHGFSQGGIIGEVLKTSGEDGIAFVKRKEGIIPVKMMPEWENLITSLPALNHISDTLSDLSTPALLPSEVNRSAANSVNNTHMEVVLPNVMDYNSFVAQMQRDKRFEKIIQSITIGEALGKNTLTKNIY